MIFAVRTDPFLFRCVVNKGGYEWAKGMLDPEDHLVPRVMPEARVIVRDVPAGLFREFAELKPARGAIIEFANNYGDIFSIYGTYDFALQGTAVTEGTSFRKWKAEIGDMRVIVDLWQATERRNTDTLKQIITLDPGKGIRYSIKTPKRDRSKWLEHSDFTDVGRDLFMKGDVLSPARHALHHEINARLADSDLVALPQLAWTPDEHQRLTFKPSALLSAMWLQFAQAVTGEFQLKICEACGRYFQAGPGGRRADATTCSDACRQRKRRMMLTKS